MKKYLQSFLITLSLLVGVGIAAPASTALAQSTDNTYSCGTYGSSAYNSADCTGSVTPPNTGFARFLEPDYLLPIIGFLVLIGVGTFLIVRARRRQA